MRSNPSSPFTPPPPPRDAHRTGPCAGDIAGGDGFAHFACHHAQIHRGMLQFGTRDHGELRAYRPPACAYVPSRTDTFQSIPSLVIQPVCIVVDEDTAETIDRTQRGAQIMGYRITGGSSSRFTFSSSVLRCFRLMLRSRMARLSRRFAVTSRISAITSGPRSVRRSSAHGNRKFGTFPTQTSHPLAGWLEVRFLDE